MSSSNSAASSSSAIPIDPNNLFKLNLYSTWDESPYFSLGIILGGDDDNEGQEIELRVDIVQPEIWVMDGNAFFNCLYLDAWVTSVGVPITPTATATTSLAAASGNSKSSTPTTTGENIIYSVPSNFLTYPEAQATVCAWGGVYTPLPSTATVVGNLSHLDGTNFTVPYFNLIEVDGNFATNNLSVVGSNGNILDLPGFTFLNSNNASAYYGALGLAGHPTGTGFLNSMKNSGYIKSAGYSLWFNGSAFNESSVGQLLPGYVDQAYYQSPFLSFPMLPYHHVSGSPETDQEYDSWNVTIPSLLLGDFTVENPDTGQSLSLLSDPLPVMLDSRASSTYLPLQLILSLALQLNAYYSEDIGLWLVPCKSLALSTSTLNFQFNSLNVKIPISEFMSVAYYGDSPLKFSGGETACALSFQPSDATGYNALGLSFIANVYLAVDNEGRNIAIAAHNQSIPSGHLVPTTLPSAFISAFPSGSGSFTQKATASNATILPTIAYIESGKIPFASSVTFATTSTLFITASPSSNITSILAVDVPARLYGRISGGVVVTAVAGSASASRSSASASAARQKTLTAAAVGQFHGLKTGEMAIRLGVVYTLVLVMLGVAFL